MVSPCSRSIFLRFLLWCARKRSLFVRASYFICETCGLRFTPLAVECSFLILCGYIFNFSEKMGFACNGFPGPGFFQLKVRGLIFFRVIYGKTFFSSSSVEISVVVGGIKFLRSLSTRG